MESKESTELAPLSKRTIAVRNKAEAVHRLMSSLEDVVNIRSNWLEDKREELARAIEAHKQLAIAGADKTKMRYANNRVSMLRKMVNALEAGFIPIPRFDSERVNMTIDQMPIKALIAFNDANATALFDEVRIVRGKAPEGVGVTRTTRQDPLLIGVIKMMGAKVTLHGVWRGGYRTNQHKKLPAQEEHFLVSWWRPTEETPEDMW